MKVLIVLALAFILLAPTMVSAETYTGSSEWNDDIIGLNPMAQHVHSFKGLRHQIGAKADLIWYHDENVEVETENRYDFNNNRFSSFTGPRVYMDNIFHWWGK